MFDEHPLMLHAVGLVQPFLVLQVFVPKEARFTVELR